MQYNLKLSLDILFFLKLVIYSCGLMLLEKGFILREVPELGPAEDLCNN